MNKRLKEIRVEAKLTQSEFAKRLDVKNSNYIYLMESGRQPVTDRVISTVCRVFGVREEWLRDGEEPMYIANSKIGAAVEWAMSALTGEDDFKRRFLEVLAKLPEEHWSVIENLVYALAEKEKRPEAEAPGRDD